jgi:hypothetical protein
MPREQVTITKERYEELLKFERVLAALEQAGVDNWEGYGEATQTLEDEDLDISDNVNNILLNMSGGLLPENLSKEEINILKKAFGKNWFTYLGYTEDKYKKPKIGD